MSPSGAYAAGIARGDWQDDPAQHPALAELDRIHAALVAAPERTGFLSKLFSRRDQPSTPGLYLWGGVGRGKTFLIDLFYDQLPIAQKRRTHFHRFMREVHERLREHAGERDPLALIAREWRASLRVLVLDEFFVGDIGDAMLLGRLLDRLFGEGVVLVTTSNTPPRELYKDGLQRARFLPAIASIERHCQVVEMVSAHDWRLRALSQAPVYHTPPGAEAERALARIFDGQAHGETREGGSIAVNDRAIPLRKRADNVLWFDFAALCEGPRSVADYIALARAVPTVIVSNVPQFNAYSEDAAKRFVQLVDEFYDRHVKLVLSAAAPITELYDGERHRAEFGRTESRLIEMQSQDYLALPHRPG
jgi:cell division protein ZapE